MERIIKNTNDTWSGLTAEVLSGNEVKEDAFGCSLEGNMIMRVYPFFLFLSLLLFFSAVSLSLNKTGHPMCR